MKVGDRGQVTIPKDIRDRFGITPETEVEFLVENGQILLRKRAAPLPLAKWKGFCRQSGSPDVDRFMDDVRGR